MRNTHNRLPSRYQSHHHSLPRNWGEFRTRPRGTAKPEKTLNSRVISKKEAADLICGFLETLDCPRALTVWLLFKSQRDHRQLTELVCSTSMYRDMRAFRDAYAATKLLSKCRDLNTGIDTEAVALRSAAEAELKNRETNQRLRGLRFGGVTHPHSATLFKAKQMIAEILGPCPNADFIVSDTPQGVDEHWEMLLDVPGFKDNGWSSGRTTSVSGDQCVTVFRYSVTPDATASARKYANKLLSGSPLWLEARLELGPPTSSLVKTTRGNVMLVVPKNAKTDRVICYEPHMNIRLQLAIGDYIRRRLLRHGVNLNDQTINQRRATLGSTTGLLATLDLKSASDTLAYELVWELLPFDWACLLDDLRSHDTLWPDGTWRRNQKFSSMGNGFTFELESLIFYAICSTVTANVSVFGDDIILPTEAYEPAVSALNFCGFDVNLSKSFNSGPFRESCGEDAYLGVNVTPFYLRSLPKRLRDVVKFHNGIFAWATRQSAQRTCFVSAGDAVRRLVSYSFRWGDSRVIPLMVDIQHHFPSYLGPSGFGDGHYHVPLDRAQPVKASGGLEGWEFSTEVPIYSDTLLGEDARFDTMLGKPALLAALGPRRPRSLEDTVLNRKNVGYRSIRTLASKWPEYQWI